MNDIVWSFKTLCLSDLKMTVLSNMALFYLVSELNMALFYLVSELKMALLSLVSELKMAIFFLCQS